MTLPTLIARLTDGTQPATDLILASFTLLTLTGLTFALLFFAGRALCRQAAAFITAIEGVPPATLPGESVFPGVFTTLATITLVTHLIQGTPWTWGLRDLLLLAWCVSFTQLDLARRWLPLPFTLSFALSGLLLATLVDAVVPPLTGLLGALLLAGILLCLRAATHRQGTERLGLGDVWLLSGLCLWLPLTAVALLTTVACSLMALTLLAVRHRTTATTPQPFAPWLCLVLAVCTLLPRHLGLY